MLQILMACARSWLDIAGNPFLSKAQTLLASITNSEFLVSMCSLNEFLVLINYTSILSQTENLNIQAASGSLFIVMSKRSNSYT